MRLPTPNTPSSAMDASASPPLEIVRGNSATAIGDPRLANYLGNDADWPALPARVLTREHISQALGQFELIEPATRGDGNRFAGRSLRAAAVMVPIIERVRLADHSGLTVLLTHRASTLRDHAGQIAFPGGACDAADVDVWATAQREAQEEIGLGAEHCQYIGRFHTYTTVTAYEVVPCLAWVDSAAGLTLNADEVASTFEVPLDFLMNPANHERRSVNTPVGERTFYAIPYTDSKGQNHFIWGATAGILRNLYRILANQQSIA